MNENIEKVISQLTKSLEDETFVKMTLGNYRGTDAHLQKLLIRPLETKKGARLYFLYRHETRDTAKNFNLEEGVQIIHDLLGASFFSGHLFTLENNFQLDISKKGKSRLNAGKPTFIKKPDLTHNREKQILVNQNSFYLNALGITTEAGEIRDKQHDKWRQINKFIETLGSLFDKSTLSGRQKLNVVDMGSGKGYLTFAAFDYFKNTRGIDVKMTGVEAREELVKLCANIARAGEFENLEFQRGLINDFEMAKVDVLIALHACDTATDDAIFRGIRAGADLIIVAPCCHREIRPQIKAPKFLSGILRHGTILEREAETLTDGLRALLLERSGYLTKIFEFVSAEHTPKNNMIVGTRTSRKVDFEKLDAQIKLIKEFYGIKEQRLENLLA